MYDGNSVLHKIIRETKLEVARRCARVPERDLRCRIRDAPSPRPFARALRDAGFALIAEFKRASPSKGAIYDDADPVAIAHAYEAAGAHALSVLTNGPFFRGADADLIAVRGTSALPVLRKDFVVNPYQLYEARALGADAVLLIVAALDVSELRDLIGVAESIGLSALVETHTLAEIECAVGAGARLLGINNRNLHTFETSVQTTVTLLKHVPRDVTVISESGIRTGADVELLRQSGVQGILVGESLMRAAKESPEALRRQTANLLGTGFQ